MKIIDSELFIRLRQLCGESYQDFMMKKLVPVAGNVCELNLGMSADLAAEIANEVDVIVNSAANTCFDERFGSPTPTLLAMFSRLFCISDTGF